jgi:site-specific DNA recombinase
LSFRTRGTILKPESEWDEIPRLQAEIDLLKISYVSKEEVMINAGNLYKRWPDLPYEQRRQITDVLT